CEESLEPGDIWVFGTDGIWEARDRDHEFFGKDRLIRIVKEQADGPLDALSERIRTELIGFHEGAERTDDITGVFLRVKSDAERNAPAPDA
ncbi:MAG: SpoIIE family protein phosphatase, partial [Gemmatimonadetes bacterium]|nr:SpoIIE family protein phosphatase [Gemmatimonadota bacterium]